MQREYTDRNIAILFQSGRRERSCDIFPIQISLCLVDRSNGQVISSPEDFFFFSFLIDRSVIDSNQSHPRQLQIQNCQHETMDFCSRADPTYLNDLTQPFGSGIVSLNTGKLYGVSKMVGLIVVKYSKNVASFLDGLSNIVEHGEQQDEAGMKVKGTVANIGWNVDGLMCCECCQEQMEDYVRQLVEGDKVGWSSLQDRISVAR